MAPINALLKKPQMAILGYSLAVHLGYSLAVLDGLVNGVQPSVIPKYIVTRQDFPPDFKFGCSTSALQTEGAGDEGGRGPSTWDSYIQDGIGGKDVAADSYHRYKEDVQLLKKMGADTYRFSIAWPRILPHGTVSGGINQEGIDFYNNFIDELLKNGITPFVTLFHFDLPQALQNKYKGFLSGKIVDDFKAYADICFKNFGDRVKHWITVNEPSIFVQYGPNPTTKPADSFLAAHHILIAHATAFKLYRENYLVNQRGEIGMSLVTEWFEPYTDTSQDNAASVRAFDFLLGWFMGPLVFGDYPFIMKALVRDVLPAFTDEEKVLIKGSFDFIGANYYTSRYAVSLPISSNESYTSLDQYQHVELKVDRNGKLIGELAPGSDVFYIYPQGLRKALVFLKEQYNNPKIYITENGYPEKREDTIPVESAVQDNARIKHILSHLYAISEAMKMGANVNGYLMWSLMDSMEPGSGYQVRFGLNYMDYLSDLERIPKKSAIWLNSFLNPPQ